MSACNAFVYFDVPDAVLIDRLLKRGQTSGRVDDNQETISKRLETFHGETTPILNHYRQQGKLVSIDANRKPDDIFADVSKGLDPLLTHHRVGKHHERSHSSSTGLFQSQQHDGQPSQGTSAFDRLLRYFSRKARFPYLSTIAY